MQLGSVASWLRVVFFVIFVFYQIILLIFPSAQTLNPLARKRERVRDSAGEGRRLNLQHVGGSPTPNHFLLFVQKKVIKENHTPLPLLPSILAPHLGGCGTRLLKSFRLKQSSPLFHLPLKPKARQGMKTMR